MERKLVIIGVSLSLSCIATILIGMYSFSHGVHRRTDETIAELSSRGYVTSYQKLESRIPILEDEENFAVAYRNAFAEPVEPSEALKERVPIFRMTTDIIEWRAFDAEATLLARDFLDQNQRALELLDLAANIKRGVYITEFSRGYDTPLPHLANLRASVRLLCLEAESSAQSNEMDAAAESIICALRARDSLDNEPFFITQLVRIALNGIIFRSISRVLSVNELSKSGLHSILTKLDLNDSAHQSFLIGIEGEIAVGDILFHAFGSDSSEFDLDAFLGEHGKWVKTLASLPLGQTWITANRRAYLRYMLTFLTAAELPDSNMLNASE